ncbi:hypothetical protein [Clostridium sp. KNHs216]|uniref:hypothetical protein n=1 Tax=Clostridium sp. KNHs216 TaxID=1550235 RepID=UPI001152FDC4|nr:hypothetical protein [Clostridium sp. KNHs216]TQI66290.1 hypothetical protein LY85_0952 [Clostridium sp. KNHs216]
MKIRTGFITNSSSTNFLIISKEELTENYLFEKLGFVTGGALEKQGRELCGNIMCALEGGLRYYDYDKPDYERIKEIFGDKSAKLYDRNKGYHAYWGYTSSDDPPITQFFTTDSFEIENKDFYLNGRACVW